MGHAPAQSALSRARWALLRHGAPRGGLVVAGLAAGATVASRPSAGLVALVIAACAVLSRARGPSARERSAWSWLIVAAHNMAVFGSLQGGYAELHRTHAEHHGVPSAWGGSMVAGLAGVLVSPSRGLFVYAPVLIFPVVGLAAWLVRRRVGAARMRGARRRGGVGTIAQFSVWWGGHSFALACSLDVLPAVVLGLVPIWPAVRRRALGERCSPSRSPSRSWWRSWGAFSFPVASRRGVEHEPRGRRFRSRASLDSARPSASRASYRNGPTSGGFRTTP